MQLETHARVLTGELPPTVLLLEHDPVITVTKKDSAAAHLLASPDWLGRHGIGLAQTDRGGDITYHGPGQLVVYPIVPLQGLGMNVRQYVASLEQAVIETLAAFGVEGQRDCAGIGVWVEREGKGLGACGLGLVGRPEPQAASREPQAAKIAAIGVRVRRWVTLHGLALNVTTRLDHFELIVPCGLMRPVTSLQQILADGCPVMEDVKRVLIASLCRVWGTGVALHGE